MCCVLFCNYCLDIRLCSHCINRLPCLYEISATLTASHMAFWLTEMLLLWCGLCFRAKTRYDLNNHLATHSSYALHCCKEKGCGSSFRSAYGLCRHYRRVRGLVCFHFIQGLWEQTLHLRWNCTFKKSLSSLLLFFLGKYKITLYAAIWRYIILFHW